MLTFWIVLAIFLLVVVIQIYLFMVTSKTVQTLREIDRHRGT